MSLFTPPARSSAWIHAARTCGCAAGGWSCATLSCFLVLRGWSLMGDAVSHAVLPGIVVAHVLALPLTVGAFAAGLFTAWLTARWLDPAASGPMR